MTFPLNFVWILFLILFFFVAHYYLHYFLIFLPLGNSICTARSKTSFA